MSINWHNIPFIICALLIIVIAAASIQSCTESPIGDPKSTSAKALMDMRDLMTEQNKKLDTLNHYLKRIAEAAESK